MAQKIVPNLWFDTEAEQAAAFYTSVFKDSRIVKTSHYTDAGPREVGTVMTVEFELDGPQPAGEPQIHRDTPAKLQPGDQAPITTPRAPPRHEAPTASRPEAGACC
jgi:hypothetical protein